MLYELIRPISNITFRTLMRKINIVDADKFPKGEPVILSSNHPTAFLEPCLLACYLERPLYFMVRGDFFKNPIFRQMMFGVHLIPIHRIEGGVSNIRKNYDIFKYCYDALDENHTILIMAEGKTRQHMRLGPLKKGTARLALGFVDEKERKDGLITPVAVNFSRADHWRTDVNIKVGDSFKMADFYDAYKDHPQKGYDALNQKVHQGLRDAMFFVEEPEDEKDAQFVMALYRTPHTATFYPHIIHNKKWFEEMQKLASGFEYLENKDELKQKIQRLRSDLKMHGISEEHLHLNKNHLGQEYIYLIVLLPFFVLGVLTNFLTALIARGIVRSKVRQLEFAHPIRAGVILGLNLFFWPGLVIIALSLQSIPLVIIALLKPFWAFMASKYYDLFQLVQHTKRFLNLDKEKKSNFRTLYNDVKMTLWSANQ